MAKRPPPHTIVRGDDGLWRIARRLPRSLGGGIQPELLEGFPRQADAAAEARRRGIHFDVERPAKARGA